MRYWWIPLGLVFACGGSAPSEPNPPDETIKETAVPIEQLETDVAYDVKRNLLYLAFPNASRIGVYSLADGAYRPSILVSPNRPTGLEISPDSDTLYVSLPQTRTIGVIDLAGSGRVSDTIPLEINNFQGRRPDKLRLMANRHLLVSVTFNGSGFGGQIIDYNLATGAQEVRTDVGINQAVTEDTRLTRSDSRQSLLLVLNESCCPLAGFLYQSGSNQFTSLIATVGSNGPSISASQDGTRFLLNSSLFSGSLALLQTYAPPGSTDATSALSADGLTGYFGTFGGMVAVRLSDGLVTATYRTPNTPLRSLVLPGGRALVVFTIGKLHVFRL